MLKQITLAAIIALGLSAETVGNVNSAFKNDEKKLRLGILNNSILLLLLIATAVYGQPQLVNTTHAQNKDDTRMMDRITKFLAAAEKGDTTKVARSLNHGIEINVTDEYDQTALMLAAEQGHANTVKLLLQHRASLDLQNKLGGTALMLASFNGHLDVVTELVKAGADVNAKSDNGYTALKMATVKQNESAVQIINLLLDQKADINTQDKEGFTALMTAVDMLPPPPFPVSKKAKHQKEYYDLQRKEEIRMMTVKTLVMRGADLSLRDQHGRTASEIARMSHQTRISEVLKSR